MLFRSPFYSRRIGIVTAPTGAAIRDIINIARRRNPYVQLILYPALVQGEQAAASIVKGIQVLERYGVDVMIVGRGGGSIEDLWAFNEEIVAKAIFACKTPVISAVGHETDTTIADYVADLRAPTPSAAAELAVADYRQLLGGMELFKNQLTDRLEQKILWYRQRLENQKLLLLHASPRYKLRKLEERKHQVQLYAERLEGCSPLKKLQQGYSYIETKDKKALQSILQIQTKEQVTIHVTDGKILACVEAIEPLERNG